MLLIKKLEITFDAPNPTKINGNLCGTSKINVRFIYIVPHLLPQWCCNHRQSWHTA